MGYRGKTPVSYKRHTPPDPGRYASATCQFAFRAEIPCKTTEWCQERNPQYVYSAASSGVLSCLFKSEPFVKCDIHFISTSSGHGRINCRPCTRRCMELATLNALTFECEYLYAFLSQNVTWKSNPLGISAGLASTALEVRLHIPGNNEWILWQLWDSPRH